MEDLAKMEEEFKNLILAPAFGQSKADSYKLEETCFGIKSVIFVSPEGTRKKGIDTFDHVVKTYVKSESPTSGDKIMISSKYPFTSYNLSYVGGSFSSPLDKNEEELLMRILEAQPIEFVGVMKNEEASV